MSDRKPGHPIDRTPIEEDAKIQWVAPVDEDLPPIEEVPWSKPSLTPAEWDACWRVFHSGWVTMGKEVAQFEAELAQYLEAPHVVLFDHGTSALLAALLAHDAKQVRLPAYTFPATMNAVHFSGAYPNFGDVDPDTVIMKPEVFDGIQVPVSYAGLGLNEQEWEGHDVVEDAAEAFGAEMRDKKVGGQGWTACFSFHAAKLLTMIEGGAVSTFDDKIAERLRIIRNHGEDPWNKGSFIMRGLNLKPNDMQAAIGRIQLRRIEEHLENRFRASVFYEKELDDLVKFQDVPDYKFRHANMMMPIFVEDPHYLAAALRDKSIGTRTGWAPLLDTDNARHVYEHVICLPKIGRAHV